jgi:hypothetical protein
MGPRKHSNILRILCFQNWRGNRMRMYKSLTVVIVTIAILYATGSTFAAGLPAPQDVEDQLKNLYPNEHSAEMFPKGDQFEVLFLSPDHPTSCLVDVATHRVSNCHYDDAKTQQQSPGKSVRAGLNLSMNDYICMGTVRKLDVRNYLIQGDLPCRFNTQDRSGKRIIRTCAADTKC